MDTQLCQNVCMHIQNSLAGNHRGSFFGKTNNVLTGITVLHIRTVPAIKILDVAVVSITADRSDEGILASLHLRYRMEFSPHSSSWIAQVFDTHAVYSFPANIAEVFSQAPCCQRLRPSFSGR